jgi:Cys-rich protein (TIGR01571 family)
MAAPASNTHNNGPINNNDIEDWKNRFNEVLAKPGDHINAPEHENSRDWNSGFFGCCSPIDTCLITWCLPCITFGKTHHITRKGGNLEGYEPINTSCLLFLGSMCVGLHWIPQSMQRADIRRKYQLKGTCITDLAVACCCALCDLVQQEKEATYREAELGNSAQYKQEENSMTYAPKA